MSDDLHSLSGAFVLDALSDGERADFEVHLGRCETCRDEVDSLRGVTPLLAETVAVSPPPALRADIMAAIRTTRQDPPVVDEPAAAEPVAAEPVAAEPAVAQSDTEAPTETNVVPLRRRVSRQWAALAAAAALVVGGGVTWQVVEQATTSISDQVLEASDAQTWQATTDDGGTVRVVRSDQMGKAVLRVEGLADPGSGKAYQAWLQDSSGSMVSAGMMTTTDGEMLLEGDVEGAAGVGLTKEPAAGSPQPTSAPVALIALG
ncbi:hypothetical protein ASG73_07975 [Janibacter sp. Soil728]|uniref:anti-sigma factor n=1 Tax=Janibacter sp. Soil728 TaxID=1736393 RepID=UPI0006F248CD|nr:anti-sigma factor [Janibacter sp. Soil728]KRE37592.1 hypothetical protein ASG73_07975 [Janibacter sp. Soil728]